MKSFILTINLCFLIGCASISDGTLDGGKTILVTSNPNGATVLLRGVPYGTTPCKINILKSDLSQDIKFEMSGFYPVVGKLERHGDSWVVGNVIAGGVIGVGFDLISGNSKKTKNSLHINLTQRKD